MVDGVRRLELIVDRVSTSILGGSHLACISDGRCRERSGRSDHVRRAAGQRLEALDEPFGAAGSEVVVGDHDAVGHVRRPPAQYD